MQRGKHLVINLKNTLPNFKRDYDTENLPLSSLIMDPIKLKRDYLKIVRDAENRDVSGNCQGCYKMHPDFMLVFYSNAEDPDFDDSMI